MLVKSAWLCGLLQNKREIKKLKFKKITEKNCYNITQNLKITVKNKFFYKDD